MLKGGGASFGTSSDSFSLPVPLQSTSDVIFSHSCRWLSRATSTHSQLSAMDVSVRSTMKGAAKCDKHCELQNSVNRQGLERILCFWDIPESMPASVSTLCCSSSCSPLRGMLLVSSCASGRAFGALEVFDGQGSASTASLLSALRCHLVAARRCGLRFALLFSCVSLFECGTASRHEVRLANPLNLSI